MKRIIEQSDFTFLLTLFMILVVLKEALGGGDLLIIVENMLFSLPNLNVAFNLKTFLFVVVFRKWGPDGNTESPFRLIPLPFKMIHFVVFDSEWFCINLSTCKTHLCMWQSTLHIFARPYLSLSSLIENDHGPQLHLFPVLKITLNCPFSQNRSGRLFGKTNQSLPDIWQCLVTF